MTSNEDYIKEIGEYFYGKTCDCELKVNDTLNIKWKKDSGVKHINIIRNGKTYTEKDLEALEIIKENLNIDEILLAVKGVCKASDYDLVKEVLTREELEK